MNLYRLPTEAEWEYACRAGSMTRFNWGEQADCTKANFAKKYVVQCCDCEGDKKYRGDECFVSPLSGLKYISNSKYPPNAWGVFDMHGNMFEWCQDWYGKYPENSVIDPKGPSSGEYRVVRGGSMDSRIEACRSANRYYYDSDYSSKINYDDPRIRDVDYNLTGFRLVREVPINP